VDSPHHVLIVSLMAAFGRVPDNYLPLLPVRDFVYHFGFHALAATLAWLSGLSTPALFLLLGQTLNGLVPLCIYSFVTGLSRQPRAGLVAAFFAGLVSLFPAYYISWGRYTQLAGGLILLPALVAVWALVPSPAGGVAPERSWRSQLPGVGAVALLAAGLALTHYRVLVFFGVAVLVILALGGRGGWKLAGGVLCRGGGGGGGPPEAGWGGRTAGWTLGRALAGASHRAGFAAGPAHAWRVGRGKWLQCIAGGLFSINLGAQLAVGRGAGRCLGIVETRPAGTVRRGLDCGDVCCAEHWARNVGGQ
jgi:hypothetical protein